MRWWKRATEMTPAEPSNLDKERTERLREIAAKLGHAEALVKQHEATIQAQNTIFQRQSRRVTELEEKNVALEADRDRHRDIAIERLNTIDELRAEVRQKDGQIEDQADQLEAAERDLGEARDGERAQRKRADALEAENTRLSLGEVGRLMAKLAEKDRLLESLRANDERMRQVVEDAERDAAEARRLLGEAVGPL